MVLYQRLVTLFILLSSVFFSLEAGVSNTSKADILWNKAMEEASRQDWQKAIRHFLECSEYYRDINNGVNYNYAHCLYRAGMMYYHSGSYSNAIDYLEQSYSIVKNLSYRERTNTNIEYCLTYYLCLSYCELSGITDDLYKKAYHYLDGFLIENRIAIQDDDKLYEYLNVCKDACKLALANQKWIDCIIFSEIGCDELIKGAKDYIFEQNDKAWMPYLDVFLYYDIVSSFYIGCFDKIRQNQDFYFDFVINTALDQIYSLPYNSNSQGVINLALNNANFHHHVGGLEYENKLLQLIESIIRTNPSVCYDYDRERLKYYLARRTLDTISLEAIKNTFPEGNFPFESLECTILIAKAYLICGKTQIAYKWITSCPDSILNKVDGTFLQQDYYYYKSLCELKLGLKEKALKTIQKFNSIMMEHVRNDFPRLISVDRQDYWQNSSKWFSAYLPSLVNICNDRALIENCLNATLLYKNALLESNANLIKLSHTSSDPSILYYLREFRSKENGFIIEYNDIKANESRTTDDLVGLLIKWFEVKQEERKALNIVNNYETPISNFIDITWKDVKSHLNYNEAAVEFILSYDLEGNGYYNAMLIKKEYSSPKLIKLCKATDLYDLEINKCINEGFDLIWKPLYSELEGMKCVYFSADAQLHVLPIEYCYMPNGSPLANQFSIVRLSSSRNLLKTNNKSVQDYRNSFVFGNIDYNANFERVKNHIEEFRDNNKQKIHDIEYVQTLESTYDSRSSMIHNIWDDLNTDEIGEVEMILKKNSIKSELFSSFRASEDIMKTLSFRGIDLLHISTHGLYVQPSQYSKYPYLTFINSDANPMNCSMLLMAGVNNLIKNGRKNKYVCDGLLLSSDIADLNLNDVDLVVLSTCDSGLGSITSDGVWGMQRGFKQAGCNTILMSLSEVDKEATSFFMESFYRNLFIFKSKQKALYEAQKEMRESEDYNEPSQWASFILLDAN